MNIFNSNDNSNENDSNFNKNKNQVDRKVSREKIIVKNLEWTVHENMLKKFFSKFGEVKKCTIIRNLYTGKSKGFGFVEFCNENAAASVFNASKEDLILINREMKIEYFSDKPAKIKPKNPKVKKFASSPTATSLSPSSQTNNTTITITNANEINESQSNQYDNKFNAQDLPYNVLALVFSELTMRDLCMVERVCKRWNEIARYVWQTKHSLVFNQKNVFGDYKKNNVTGVGFFGFVSKPLPPHFKKILKKVVGLNLKHLDLSEHAEHYGVTSLLIISDECPNLTHLNISKISTSNYNFVRMVKRCTKLKDLNMSYCSKITDASLTRLFQNCKDLENLDITFCHSVTGKCFARANNNLKKLVIDQCENISDENLLILFSKNKNFTHLSMKRCNKFWNATLISIINNMSKLKVLNLADSGFDSLNAVNIENIRFENLISLTSLDLSNSCGDNNLTSLLLRKSYTLKSLNLSYCYKITDDLFTNAQINSPLEELNLNFINQISDETLKSLTQLSSTLKILNLKGCQKVTNEGACFILQQLTNLTNLDIRSNYKIENSLLDTAINLNRKIEILCNDTSIDTSKFTYKYDETVKELIDRNYFRFKYKNLTFESSLFEANKFRKNSDQVKIWEEDGLFYIGSPFDTEDEEEWYDGYDGDDGDDGDFFDDDEEQEMLRELDE